MIIKNFLSIFLKGLVLFFAMLGTSDGGDEPEALEDGLRDALTLSWKSDIRMCVLVADQPPHGLSHVLQDNYPAGKLFTLLILY